MSSSMKEKERGRDGKKPKRSERVKRYHQDGDGDNVPRAFDPDFDSYSPPEEEFAKLRVDSGETNSAHPTEETESASRTGKGKETAIVENPWSEYEWNEKDKYWWSSRINSQGKWEYTYDYNTPGPSYNFTTKPPAAGNEAPFSSLSQVATETTDQLPPMPIHTTPKPPCDCDYDPRKNLCRVLVFPKDPKPTDGKITKKQQKVNAASTSSSDQITIQGPDGKNCGPLYVPGITPGPRPLWPPEGASEQESIEYWDRQDAWDEAYEEWKHITCPCGLGYFDIDGVWVSGADVRSGKSPNPLWKENGGKAPPRESKYKKYRGKLSERNDSGS